MSFESSTTLLQETTCLGLENRPAHLSTDSTMRDGQKTRFYVELEEKCKRQAAKEVSELKAADERKDERESGHDLTVARVPRYLKEENISRIENYLSEYYMETVYQRLWEKAQNAVFGAECMS
ncbi:Hypothetical predicted protein [Paramuricea clavata]|uniref:Uncharacterized protein n=1 Tax=Paramuricea clavata TaxID=317549 RepID=A0A6S7H4X4_PARCT|nr:Hypothetical predicted protein [Paramuricea clavata]